MLQPAHLWSSVTVGSGRQCDSDSVPCPHPLCPLPHFFSGQRDHSWMNRIISLLGADPDDKQTPRESSAGLSITGRLEAVTVQAP